MTNGLEVKPNLLENGRQNDNQITAVLYIDNSKENDLVQFIIKAQQQGCNCLDLSKRNISQFPSQLLDFPSLQYLYLEGNQLTQLPADLFLRLPNLKWIDLRNNQLTSIPNHGLAKHQSLQYLLLSRNLIQKLPAELGKVKTLSALNLDGNPLVHPPFEIIKQGVKTIQHYLRDDQFDSDDEQQMKWISDEDQRRTTRPHSSMDLRKSKSELSYYDTSPPNLLPAHLRSCIQFKRMSYSETRTRPSTAARSRPQSEMRLPQVKTTRITRKMGDVDLLEEQQLIHLKHRSIDIDEDTQTRSNYQQSLRSKSFMQNKNNPTDYEQPIVQTPFHIDPHYIQDIIKYPTRQNQSPDCSMREQDESRMYDLQIQDRIRQITDKMLKRRNETHRNPFEEKRQAKLELREIRQLDFEGQQRQAQIDIHSKPSSGNIKSRKKL